MLALAATFAASWREASVWAKGMEGERAFLPLFLERLAVRFLGYGLVVALAAPIALLLVSFVTVVAATMIGLLNP
jgi:hypothetical protein